MDLYLGNGFFELEFDGVNYFKWISDQAQIYLCNDKITKIGFHLWCELDTTIEITLNDKKIDFQVDGSEQIIEFECKNVNQLNIKSTYFIPSDLYKTSDTRKLSCRFYKIKVSYDNDEEKTYLINEVSHWYGSTDRKINTKFANINVDYVGNYGYLILKNKSENFYGTLNLDNQVGFYSHRSGWISVIERLMEKHNNPDGVIFDGFLENTFVWQKNQSINLKKIPYKKSWIGIFHNPPNMPSWLCDNNAMINLMIQSDEFKKSLIHCKGIFTLSNYLATYLKNELPGVKVNVLYLPTEIPELKFSYEKFYENNDKKLINIGWWLRRLNYFYKIKSPFKKVRLNPKDSQSISIKRIMEREKIVNGIEISNRDFESVHILDYVDNQMYDSLLSENIVYIDLYDSSANNVIVECIARNTPILINKLKPVVEYLGEDYPFYFESYDQVSNKLCDFQLIEKTYEYLKNFEGKSKIKLDTFDQMFHESEIYKSL